VTPRLILASTSRYRSALLQRLGVPFEAIAPDVDESEAKGWGLSPRDLALELAGQKARAVATKHPDAVVIGSDQVGDLDGDLLDKPGTDVRACAQLMTMQGRTHRLWTAVYVVGPAGAEAHWVDETRLTMRALSAEQIAAYVAADQPLDCCGSFKIESRGVALFSKVEGADPTAIEGLPLMRLTTELAAFDIDPFARQEPA
jgi:septum formation protein